MAKNFYLNVSSNEGNFMELDQFIQYWIECKLYNDVLEARYYYEIGDMESYEKIKRSLPVFFPTVLLEGGKSIDDVIKYLGIILIDIDKLTKKRARKAVKLLEDNQYIMFAGLSLSGHGVKIMVKVVTSIEYHKIAYEQVVSYIEEIVDEVVDRSGSNANRGTIISMDEEAWYCADSSIFPVKLGDVDVMQKDAHVDVFDSKSKYEKEQILNDIVNYVEENRLSLTVGYPNWRDVAFAISSFLDGEKGFYYFERLSKLDDNYNKQTCRSDWGIFVKSNESYEGRRITIGTIISKARELGYQTKDKLRFWIIEKKVKGDDVVEKPKVKGAMFGEYLESLGVRKYSLGSGYKLVLIKNNLLTEVQVHDIQTMIKEIVKSLPEMLSDRVSRIDLMNLIYEGHSGLFSKSKLGLLEPMEKEMHRDTETECFLYFKNVFCSITKNAVESKNYSNLQGAIWKKERVEREFFVDVEGGENAVFHQFIKNVTGEVEDGRYNSLISLIGYMCHRYKDSTNAKAAILTDRGCEEDAANGRRGKSLIIAALQKIRNVAFYNGKSFRQDKSFLYQRVNIDTNIIAVDDAMKRLDFEALFPAISGDLIVEKKGQDEFVLEFSESPKILITSNYLVNGPAGSSNRARRFEVEFEDYYNDSFTPDQEFGHRFFDHWDEDEWNNFDNFIVHCIQYYLKYGLVDYDRTLLEEHSLIYETNQKFIDFMDELELHERYYISDLLEEFEMEHPFLVSSKALDIRRFSSWIRKYIVHKKIVTKGLQKSNGRNPIEKSNSTYHITIVKKDD